MLILIRKKGKTVKAYKLNIKNLIITKKGKTISISRKPPLIDVLPNDKVKVSVIPNKAEVVQC